MYRQNTTTRNQWYVAYCQPLKERQVAAALENSYVESFLPLIQRQTNGRKKYMPLFPRYLFLHVDLNSVGMYTIRRTPGLVKLVAFGETPQPVPAASIAALRQQVDTINAQGGLLEHSFQPGNAVRLTKGPLQGLQAVFIGPMHPSECVQVLLNFLGRLNKVEVDVHQLEHAEPAVPAQRERRTRGRGRPIRAQS